MNNFVAIDFETANAHRTSVCSVGIIVVRDGKISDQFYSLIHPVPDYYHPINTSIHGLDEVDTCDAPYFPEVWAQIEPLIGNLPFVAHNCQFDESCLKSVFEYYDMHYPQFKFHCTCKASRQKFGNTLPNHKLHTVAEYCGYDLLNHHNALADAEACAHIALQLL